MPGWDARMGVGGGWGGIKTKNVETFREIPEITQQNIICQPLPWGGGGAPKAHPLGSAPASASVFIYKLALHKYQV